MPDEIERLNDAKVSNRYRTGQVIFYQGNAPQGVYCVLEGTVALRRTNSDGASIIVRLAEAGETLGYRAFFGGGHYSASAEAMSDCRVCLIETSAVRALLDENPSVGMNFLGRIARDLEVAEEGRLAASALSVRARLSHLLLVLKDRHGHTDEAGNLVIDLPLARQDLAAMVGTRPETLSRAITALQDAGVVRFDGRSAVVEDLDDLLDELPQADLL